MARSLAFDFKGSEFALEIHKVDRSKLYGEVIIETLDPDGERCELASLARDGKTIIPMGGTASGYLNQDGEWVDRNALQPVNPDGEKLNEVPSSFNITTKLGEPVSIEDYLDHAIRLAYVLKPKDSLDPTFEKSLKEGAIYEVPFSYRGGAFADPAFLLADEKGNIWMMIGEPGQVDFLGFEQAAICGVNAEREEVDGDEPENDFDFEMM